MLFMNVSDFMNGRSSWYKMVDLRVIKQSTVVHLCFAISYFTSGLILSLIQGVLYFGLKPFNKVLYRKINYYLSYSFYSRKLNFCIFIAIWILSLRNQFWWRYLLNFSNLPCSIQKVRQGSYSFPMSFVIFSLF